MKKTDFDAIAAICTGPGGSISIIRISGPGAADILSRAWEGRSDPRDFPRTMLFGRLKTPGKEPCLAVFMPGPRSYTGEDVAELHCHGGSYAPRALLRLVLRSGARMAENGEFTRRAFLNGKLDLTQAEAVMELISASSERAGLLAERQLNGLLGSKIRGLRQEATHLLAECESRLDFPDEELDWIAPDDMIRNVKQLRSEIGSLLETRKAGRIVRAGISLVIAGAPNVGKSSLMNAILGFNRAIVTDIPGTTRDTLEESVEINGVLFRIADTAGLREQAGDAVEAIGMERSRDTLKTADVVLWLLDASLNSQEAIRAAIEQMREATKHLSVPMIPCWNKCDILPQDVVLPALHGDQERISAATGEGLDRLFARLEKEVWNAPPAERMDFAVAERHAPLLERAEDALARTEDEFRNGNWDLAASALRNAIRDLGSVTGETAAPDVLDEIFSRFCIGK